MFLSESGLFDVNGVEGDVEVRTIVDNQTIEIPWEFELDSDHHLKYSLKYSD